jgi:actin-like ATPase involved in cell morphogenesis
MNILGIDFGTTKTLAARWDERTKTARTIRLGRGSDQIPTTLYCDEKGEFQFGEDADDMRALDAAGWKGRIKRDLGKGAAVVLQGRSFKVVNLVSRFLVYVRQRIEKEVFHGKIDHTIITVPALYGPAERSELLDAAGKAGFKSVELVDEPVAAGRAFLHEKAGTDLGDHVLVFDWGGGTLDLALVEQRDGELQLNHDWIGGEKYLGGEDIDDAMIEEADRRYAESHGRIDDQEDGQQMHIRRNLKEGKELLSRKAQHKFRLPYNRPQDFVWTRGDFEEFTNSITDQAIDCLRKQLEKVRAQGIKTEYVLLVGGSSSIPVVKNRIEAELGLKALTWENSQTAVALGAATIWPANKKRQVSNEVECPHCDELVEVPGDGEYECPHCGENIILGEPLKLSFGWNEVGVVVFAQPAGNENELEQIMNSSHMEIMPSLFVKNISNQPFNRIQVAGAYDGSTFTVSMPNHIPVLEAGEEIELDQIILGFIVEDGMLLKVTWFGQEDDGCTIEANYALLETPLPHLPIAVFVKDGTFSGKVLQLYNGSSKKIKNLLFTKGNGATYKLEELLPGGPCNIGWYEFSDSTNLKSGDVVVITKSKHRSTIVHIQ